MVQAVVVEGDHMPTISVWAMMVEMVEMVVFQAEAGEAVLGAPILFPVSLGQAVTVAKDKPSFLRSSNHVAYTLYSKSRAS
jgi:hypothetical protein